VDGRYFRILSVYQPSFCLIAQGSKEIALGERHYRYDPAHYLLVTVDLPYTGRVVDASKNYPYLSLRLDLDPALVGSVMVEAGIPAPRSQGDAKALVVSALDADLLDATVRLVRLIDSPAQARVLAPLVKREIVFRLLLGEHGHRLRHFPLLGGHARPIAQAVERLRATIGGTVRHESRRARRQHHGICAGSRGAARCSTPICAVPRDAHRGRGSVNQKVDPSPGTLSTPTLPPCRRIIVRLMYSPNPRPPPEPRGSSCTVTPCTR
jgi:hypothetical protein